MVGAFGDVHWIVGIAAVMLIPDGLSSHLVVEIQDGLAKDNLEQAQGRSVRHLMPPVNCQSAAED